MGYKKPTKVTVSMCVHCGAKTRIVHIFRGRLTCDKCRVVQESMPQEDKVKHTDRDKEYARQLRLHRGLKEIPE